MSINHLPRLPFPLVLSASGRCDKRAGLIPRVCRAAAHGAWSPGDRHCGFGMVSHVRWAQALLLSLLGDDGSEGTRAWWLAGLGLCSQNPEGSGPRGSPRPGRLRSEGQKRSTDARLGVPRGLRWVSGSDSPGRADLSSLNFGPGVLLPP